MAWHIYAYGAHLKEDARKIREKQLKTRWCPECKRDYFPGCEKCRGVVVDLACEDCGHAHLFDPYFCPRERDGSRCGILGLSRFHDRDRLLATVPEWPRDEDPPAVLADAALAAFLAPVLGSWSRLGSPEGGTPGYLEMEAACRALDIPPRLHSAFRDIWAAMSAAQSRAAARARDFHRKD